jgi:hypothetical protein
MPIAIRTFDMSPDQTPVAPLRVRVQEQVVDATDPELRKDVGHV